MPVDTFYTSDSPLLTHADLPDQSESFHFIGGLREISCLYANHINKSHSSFLFSPQILPAVKLSPPHHNNMQSNHKPSNPIAP